MSFDWIYLLAVPLVCVSAFIILYPVFCGGRSNDYSDLQDDLDHATGQLTHVTALEVEARRRTRSFDTQRWRIKYQEALHHYYMKKWKRMWDGCADQAG